MNGQVQGVISPHVVAAEGIINGEGQIDKRSAFDSDAKNLGVFLQSLLPGNVAYEGSPIKFIDSFFPVTELAARLSEAATKGAQWTPQQQEAIRRFREYLVNEPGGDSPAGSTAS